MRQARIEKKLPLLIIPEQYRVCQVHNEKGRVVSCEEVGDTNKEAIGD